MKKALHYTWGLWWGGGGKWYISYYQTIRSDYESFFKQTSTIRRSEILGTRVGYMRLLLG